MSDQRVGRAPGGRGDGWWGSAGDVERDNRDTVNRRAHTWEEESVHSDPAADAVEAVSAPARRGRLAGGAGLKL